MVWQLLITGLIALAGASSQVSNSDPEELLAAARASEDTVRRLMTTIGNVVRDKAKLQKSSAVVANRREQLLREYSGITLRVPANYETLHQDLVAFRQKEILLAGQLFGLAAESYGQRACENLRRADALAADILSSDLAQKRVEAGPTIGDIIRRLQQELHEDDPCAPSKEADLSSTNQL